MKWLWLSERVAPFSISHRGNGKRGLTYVLIWPGAGLDEDGLVCGIMGG